MAKGNDTQWLSWAWIIVGALFLLASWFPQGLSWVKPWWAAMFILVGLTLLYKK